MGVIRTVAPIPLPLGALLTEALPANIFRGLRSLRRLCRPRANAGDVPPPFTETVCQLRLDPVTALNFYRVVMLLGGCSVYLHLLVCFRCLNIAFFILVMSCFCNRVQLDIYNPHLELINPSY